MMTPGTNNSYHYPMYHDDGSFAASAKTANARGIMVPPPMPPPQSSIPPPQRIGSNNTGTLSSTGSTGSANEVATSTVPKFAIPHNTNDHHPNTGNTNKENSGGGKELPTPSSTPTSSRKNRRRSNLFTPSKKQQNSDDTKDQNGLHGTSSVGGSNQIQQLGSGRSIPIRQGLLYKKSNKSFSKDWKKKYVTLCDDGRMTYYPNLNVSARLNYTLFHTSLMGEKSAI